MHPFVRGALLMLDGTFSVVSGAQREIGRLTLRLQTKWHGEGSRTNIFDDKIIYCI